MPGPCPNGEPTTQLHKDARCSDKERCTGPGCRVRRPDRSNPVANAVTERDDAARGL